MRNLLCILSLALLVSACGKSYVYQEEQKIPNSIWTYQNVLKYQVPVQDTVERYGLYLAVNHAQSYPNQNIYCKINTTLPSGKTQSQVISFNMYNNAGKSNGVSSGSNNTVTSVLQERFHFTELGTYSISVEQFMRSDSLQGVNAVTLQLEKMPK